MPLSRRAIRYMVAASTGTGKEATLVRDQAAT
jgi:hypothetical protein